MSAPAPLMGDPRRLSLSSQNLVHAPEDFSSYPTARNTRPAPTQCWFGRCIEALDPRQIDGNAVLCCMTRTALTIADMAIYPFIGLSVFFTVLLNIVMSIAAPAYLIVAIPTSAMLLWATPQIMQIINDQFKQWDRDVVEAFRPAPVAV